VPEGGAPASLSISGSAAGGNGRCVSEGCARLRADPIESDNIVGYQTLTVTGSFMSTGPTFITVGDQQNATWKLGDIKPSGFEAGADFVQFLDPTDGNVISSATYVDEDTALDWFGDRSSAGWWNGDIDTSLDNEVFSAGTAMLGAFFSPGITITYAGEVLEGMRTLDLSAQSFPLIANFTPVDLTLGDLTATGFEAGADFVQFLDPADANAILSATYVDEATALDWFGDRSLAGWWNGDIDASLNSTPLPTGSAFLGSFSSPDVTLTFPDPLDM
jgi:hypothetical protein